MVAGTNRDPVLVEDRAYVVRMHAFDGKSQNARFFGGGAYDLYTRYIRETLCSILEQFMFVRCSRREIDRVYVIDSGAESDSGGRNPVANGSGEPAGSPSHGIHQTA